MSVKINSLEIENVKRIKAVKLEPSANGLTIIGGTNNQGKTSVLDAIAWALGGDKYKPTAAARDGAYSNVINLKRPLNGKQNVWKYQNGEEKSDSDGREKDV